jgi:hypothetical protein
VLRRILGNYEPELFNNNPPRSPADIVANARANLVVTQGVASFFFHPDYPLSQLQAIVTGSRASATRSCRAHRCADGLGGRPLPSAPTGRPPLPPSGVRTGPRAYSVTSSARIRPS